MEKTQMTVIAKYKSVIWLGSPIFVLNFQIFWLLGLKKSLHFRKSAHLGCGDVPVIEGSLLQYPGCIR